MLSLLAGILEMLAVTLLHLKDIAVPFYQDPIHQDSLHSIVELLCSCSSWIVTIEQQFAVLYRDPDNCFFRVFPE